MKNRIFFHISAQNIDCEYSLEPSLFFFFLWGGGGGGGGGNKCFLTASKYCIELMNRVYSLNIFNLWSRTFWLCCLPCHKILNRLWQKKRSDQWLCGNVFVITWKKCKGHLLPENLRDSIVQAQNKSCWICKKTENGWISYFEVGTKFKMAATANYVDLRHKSRVSPPWKRKKENQNKPLLLLFVNIAH